jgi:hypothetical protein
LHDFEGWKEVKNQNQKFVSVLRVSTFPTSEQQSSDLSFPKIVMVNSQNLFIIEGLEKYPHSRLTILGKNGQLLYDLYPYHNNFDGQNLPCGTYYYLFSKEQNAPPMKKSFFEIVR